MQTYEEVINYLYDHLPYYQRSGQAAYKDSLDNTIALDVMFDHPHQNFKSVHVAGTNGKGSVSHMLASILMESGYKTGLYTSPHLKDFRERIQINGKKIEKEFIVEFVSEFLSLNSARGVEPSFFELTVMMAFDYFSKNSIDIAIIEVGLGGRLDSTNIITPELSVITNISLDHTYLLGDTLGKIALEKAGIIKRKIPVIIGESHPQTSLIFKGVATELSAPLSFAVIAAVEQLRGQGWNIPESALRTGLDKVCENTGLMGRWQVIGANPGIICDTGHNEGGIREVVTQISQTPYKKLHFIIGMVNDKDIPGVLNLLPRDAIYYFTKAAIPRAFDENQLSKMAAFFNLHGNSFPSVAQAIESAKLNADKDDLIFIGGSTFIVAEAIP